MLKIYFLQLCLRATAVTESIHPKDDIITAAASYNLPT
jgi:hypothetical protein